MVLCRCNSRQRLSPRRTDNIHPLPSIYCLINTQYSIQTLQASFSVCTSPFAKAEVNLQKDPMTFHKSPDSNCDDSRITWTLYAVVTAGATISLRAFCLPTFFQILNLILLLAGLTFDAWSSDNIQQRTDTITIDWFQLALYSCR